MTDSFHAHSAHHYQMKIKKNLHNTANNNDKRILKNKFIV